MLPIAESVREDAAATGIVSARLEGQVAGLQGQVAGFQKTTASLREGLEITLAAAEKLRVQKTASEAELEALWQMLADSNAKVRDLFAEADLARIAAAAAQVTADEQRDLRAKSEVNLANLTLHAADADAENAALRSQSADKDRIISDQHDEIEDKDAKLLAAEKKAAVGSYLKSWVAAAAIIVVALIAWKFFKPF